MSIAVKSDTGLYCTECGSPLRGGSFEAVSSIACEACGALFEAALFPALLSGHEHAVTGDPLEAADEASCFYHPGKRAAAPCANCGRFVCSLCEIELGDRKLCPSCVELEKDRGLVTDLVTQRTMYDQIALSLAVWPILSLAFCYVSLVAAPMAIYVAIRHWKAPTSLVPRTKIRFILAGFFAFGEMGLWAALIIFGTLHRL